jgi:hypothetical protein
LAFSSHLSEAKDLSLRSRRSFAVSAAQDDGSLSLPKIRNPVTQCAKPVVDN